MPQQTLLEWELESRWETEMVLVLAQDDWEGKREMEDAGNEGRRAAQVAEGRQ
jgi:hypothetical protein